MKLNGTLMQRNVAALMLFCSMGICLPASGLYGQAPPTAPPAGAVTPAVLPTATAPFQASPVALPPNPPLPVSLNLGSWLGRSTVYISVNGRPERLGLSTGLNANAVSPATMARLQIPEGKTKVRVDILDRETEAPETMLASLQFGLVKLENVPVAQVDVVALLSHAPHPDAPGGWLGTPFLSAFQITLDISRKVCVLNRPLVKMPAGAMVVPMTLRDGRIYVPMTLPKSKPFPALLDSSAVLSLIPASVGEKLKLPAVETFKLGGAGGKEVPATMIEAPTVAVGKAECKAMRVVYLSADSSPSFGRETAVLGLDFLSRFRVVLDFAAKKVAFVPLVSPDSDTTPKPDAPRPKTVSPRHP